MLPSAIEMEHVTRLQPQKTVRYVSDSLFGSYCIWFEADDRTNWTIGVTSGKLCG